MVETTVEIKADCSQMIRELDRLDNKVAEVAEDVKVLQERLRSLSSRDY